MHTIPKLDILDHLSPGDVFVDVGAHIGYWSILAARIIGPEGKVVALEPDPEAAELCRSNIHANELSGIVDVIQAAAWSTEGQVEFSRANLASGLREGRVGAGPPAQIISFKR
ncbi:MAG: FkbM family methyltransferase [Armatimonadota bacterium]|nr:FkbM family methyltransferase [Armatimonadota bacterium]MDR7544782.1 FkbM family methyltransferase [Armatimonadota bacterium]